MKKLNDYFINKSTCAIIPIEKEVSRVIELEDVFIVSKSTKDIIEESCKYFGSSYDGRIEGAKDILKMSYKLPIVIEDFNNIIFFPTSSPRFDDCYWLCLNNIKSYVKDGKYSKVDFVNGDVFNLDVSYYSLENQIFRATMLSSLIRKRQNG